VRDLDPAVTASFTVRTAAPEATEALGEAWGRHAPDGSLWLLVGDLGSGKTTLVRGFARGLGVRSGVRSPSFALHLTYPGRCLLHHLDLYRVTDPRDLEELGLEDVLGRSGVTVVEWGERLGSLAPPDAVRVQVIDTGGDTRSWHVTGPAGLVGILAAEAGVPPAGGRE